MARFVLLIFSALIPVAAGFAASNVDGSIFGQLPAEALGPDQDFRVEVHNPDIGIRRDTRVADNGRFRIAGLPGGKYSATLLRNGEAVARAGALVSAGVGAQVSFEPPPAGWRRLSEVEEIVVTAAAIAPIDFSQVEAVTVFNEAVVDDIPVPRSITNVALLAPGTTLGDQSFSDSGSENRFDGDLASFGGASVAENAFYINGFNITNFRTGTGFAQVPFEFMREFQVKTGGYGAEFGRSTGGVVNTNTKRGTNVWEGGINAYYEPDALRQDSPSTRLPDGSFKVDNRRDQAMDSNVNLWGGGAILQDRLFLFGLLNFRQKEGFQDDLIRTQRRESSEPFYGLKLDWNITDTHLFEFTAFSDERDTDYISFDDDPDSPTRGQRVGTQVQKRGGQNMIARYTAQFGDFSLSALYGNGKINLTGVGDRDDCPLAIDRRSGSSEFIGCWVGSGLISRARDERTAWRIDGEWELPGFAGDHVIRFGADLEDNESFDESQYTGGIYYRYILAEPGSTLNGGTVPADVEDVVRIRFLDRGGTFTTKSTALYVEDTWTVNDRLTLYLGLRNETFDNRNALDQSFIKVSNQPAPRLGLSWDIEGKARSRLFANLGRYYLPVAANTNVRLAGAEFFTQAYYQCGPDGAAESCAYNPADGTPTNQGSEIGETNVLGDGSVPDVREILDRSIDPMYQDELIFGYQSELFDHWTAGLRFIHRDLKRSIEDVTVNHALLAYAQENGLATERLEDPSESNHYVLTNPGTPLTMFFDFDEDGTLERATLSPAQLGYPKATRKYNALEFFFERRQADRWFMQGSYTWSQSYGNSEGYVRSDNGQDDAGITTLFDFPGLAEGSYGFLPNDRRHKIKLYGAWTPLDEWQVGANLLVQSGRPINAFGVHPSDEGAASYGAAAFYQNGELVPRASRGRTPWIAQMDLSLRYRPLRFAGLSFGLDIFNLLNFDKPTEVDETAEEATGAADPGYKLPTRFQAPRSMRLSAEWQFGS